MANIHVRTAVDYARRSPFQALAAIFVLALTFFVGTLLAVLVYSSGKALSHFETRPQIIAFLKDDVTAEEVSSFQNTLNKDTRVKDVAYVSKEQALEIYKNATADNPLLSELVSPSIFPASLEFSLTDLNFAEDVINEVKKISIVDQVGFTASLGGESTLGDVVTRLRTITMYVRIGGAVFVGLLVGTSLLVLLVIISMRITTRKGEMEILSLIGATKKFIRSPIIIEAMIYAFIGVFLGWIFALILVLYATPGIVSYFGEIPVLPRDTVQLFILMGIILAVEIVVGVSLALFGSSLAISRVRRNK